MKTQQLGAGGLDVSALGLGCMDLSCRRGRAAGKRDGITIIRTGFARGVTFFKTAEGYLSARAGE